MKCNVIDIVLVELGINPVPSIANANFEFHAVASGSDERIVAVHDRKASAGLRQTGLSTLLPRLRFPLSQTRLIRRHLSVCRLDGGSAKVARKFHEVVAEVVRRHQTLFRTNAQTFGNTNAIVGMTEIGEVSIPIRHHEFDEVRKLFKKPRAKPDGTKMFCSAFLNDARMCCFFANAIVKY